jgi:hypothetical protein
MTEIEWVRSFAPAVDRRLRATDVHLSVLTGKKLPYANEIRSYNNDGICDSDIMDYETDLLVTENKDGGIWKPRVIVESKFHGSITTHDAITYSHKAFTHRQVHPYLRYGILIGEREHYPLPGRLFRHGTQFDFMMSWVGANPTKNEMDNLIDLLLKEVTASRSMEEIIYESRKPGRGRYTVLHKELHIK